MTEADLIKASQEAGQTQAKLEENSVIFNFTFEVLFLTGLVYIFLIPISYFNYKQLSKKFLNQNSEDDEIEDIL